jgi:hypothetical protein
LPAAEPFFRAVFIAIADTEAAFLVAGLFGATFSLTVSTAAFFDRRLSRPASWRRSSASERPPDSPLAPRRQHHAFRPIFDMSRTPMSRKCPAFRSGRPPARPAVQHEFQARCYFHIRDHMHGMTISTMQPVFVTDACRENNNRCCKKTAYLLVDFSLKSRHDRIISLF